MIVCEICGKSDFKNTQGLRGHMTFVHGKTGSQAILSAPAATEQRLTRLEKLLDITGQDTEQPVSIALQYLDGRLELSEQQTELLTEQLKGITEKVAQQHARLLSITSTTELKVELADLKQAIGQMIGELYRMLDYHWHEGKQFVETGSGDEQEVPEVKLDARWSDARHARGYTKITYRERGARSSRTDGHKPDAIDEIIASFDDKHRGKLPGEK